MQNKLPKQKQKLPKVKHKQKKNKQIYSNYCTTRETTQQIQHCRGNTTNSELPVKIIATQTNISII